MQVLLYQTRTGTASLFRNLFRGSFFRGCPCWFWSVPSDFVCCADTCCIDSRGTYPLFRCCMVGNWGFCFLGNRYPQEHEARYGQLFVSLQTSYKGSKLVVALPVSGN